MVLSGDTPARRQEWSHSRQIKNIEIEMVPMVPPSDRQVLSCD